MTAFAPTSESTTVTLLVMVLWIWASTVSLRTFWPGYRGRPWARALLMLGAIVLPHVLVLLALTDEPAGGPGAH